VCSTKKSKRFVESLVGVPFLEKYGTRKGRSNLYILYLPIFLFLFLDVCSIDYLVSLKIEQYKAQSMSIQQYIVKENFEMAEQLQDDCLQLLVDIPNTRGIIGQMAVSPYFSMMQNYISKLLGL